MFQSITEWQAEGYLVDVRASEFATYLEASHFGNQPMRLIREGDNLVLRAKGSLQELARISDEDIYIRKLKDSSRGRNWATEEDFEPVQIPIAEFGNYPELASFGSTAYGVFAVSK